MNKKYFGMCRWYILVFFLAFNSSRYNLAAQENRSDLIQTVPIWKRIDLELKSSKPYNNEFLDVAVDGVFTHESGMTISIPGFWNGDNIWVVRFSPNKMGEWTYVITASDETNLGLYKCGELIAVANEGPTALDRRGFISISDDQRMFTYDDGYPFFWLGDTHWQAPDYERIEECNAPDCNGECGNNQFKHLVDNRISKGFNLYQMYPDAAENDGGNNLRRYNWWEDRQKLLNAPDSIKIKPLAFCKYFDVMMEYLADRGITIALGFGVHQSTADAMHEESLLHWTRYLVARYAAFPVVWITAQEVNVSPGKGSYKKWKQAARLIDQLDGYNRPLSMHTDRDYPGKYPSFLEIKDLEWHRFWAMQGGHFKDNSAENQGQEYYQKYWNANPRKPYIETEANYEQLYGHISADKVRETAWRAIQSGSYGYTYGASGIWAMNWEAGDGRGWENYSKLSWHEAKDLPGSIQMKYLKDFYLSLDFHLLVPRFDDPLYSVGIDYNKHFLSSYEDRVFILYSKKGEPLSGFLKNLFVGATYTAQWYNPRTGNYHKANEPVVYPDDKGHYCLPSKPDSNDWVYLLKLNSEFLVHDKNK
jgi:hypothetical protein